MTIVEFDALQLAKSIAERQADHVRQCVGASGAKLRDGSAKSNKFVIPIAQKLAYAIVAYSNSIEAKAHSQLHLQQTQALARIASACASPADPASFVAPALLLIAKHILFNCVEKLKEMSNNNPTLQQQLPSPPSPSPPNSILVVGALDAVHAIMALKPPSLAVDYKLLIGSILLPDLLAFLLDSRHCQSTEYFIDLKSDIATLVSSLAKKPKNLLILKENSEQL
ncbi:hypothetical protein HK100_011453 [Physocladia obscura]|uniref:Uncharacterized protein n=1 Tax=Physocladia obscura TaxID=109957 RepID=A0AAD5T2N2_9FUNG|nr:hypothetical protein HK100_011453 [Physocladia obscura]